MREPVYLDYNATAPMRPAVAHAMADALAVVGNPSSVHAFGREARRRVEDAREAVAALVGAAPAEVIFTGSGSEANNLALKGAGREKILVSAGEHDSVLNAAPAAVRLPLDDQGRVDLEAARKALANVEPALVSVMLANNETGVVQPVAEIAAMAREAGCLIHCDAVQAAGRLPVDVAELGVDMLTLSAHKLGGPKGVGALVLRPGLELAPQVVGGGQERRRRAGTENVAGIVGFGVAARAVFDHASEMARVARLRERLEAGIASAAPHADIVGKAAPRLANTTCVVLPGLKAEMQVMALDLEGVAVGAGAACSSGKVTPSHVLGAMGLPDEVSGSAIRVSLGWTSDEADVDRFLAAWRPLAARAADTAAA